MEKLIKGIAHISMKCFKGEEYDRVVDFYTRVLGLDIRSTWEDGVLLDTGNGVIEVFSNKKEDAVTGIIRHVALETDDVEACAAKVRQAGYEVFLGPKEIQVPVKAKIAFCFGPLGEQIELMESSC